MGENVNFINVKSEISWDEYFMLQAMMAVFAQKTLLQRLVVSSLMKTIIKLRWATMVWLQELMNQKSLGDERQQSALNFKSMATWFTVKQMQ